MEITTTYSSASSEITTGANQTSTPEILKTFPVQTGIIEFSVVCQAGNGGTKVSSKRAVVKKDKTTGGVTISDVVTIYEPSSPPALANATWNFVSLNGQVALQVTGLNDRELRWSAVPIHINTIAFDGTTARQA